MRKYSWTKYLKRSAPELPYDSPIYLGNWSNGEFFHQQTSYERKLREEILKVGDEKARRLGMDRREFMASAMGFVTAMSVTSQACSKSSAPPSRRDVLPPESRGAGSTAVQGPVTAAPGVAGQPGGRPAASGTGGPSAPPMNGQPPAAPSPGAPVATPPNPAAAVPGQYCFDMDSGVDPTMCDDAAREILKPPQFIFDAQTHRFEDAPDAMWRKTPPPGFNDSLRALLFGKCTDDPVSCIGPDDYVRLMFLESSTTMTVLSAWPYGQGPNDPNSIHFWPPRGIG